MNDDNGAKSAMVAQMRSRGLSVGDTFSAQPMQSRLVIEGWASDEVAAAMHALSSDGLIKGQANSDRYLITRKLQR